MTEYFFRRYGGERGIAALLILWGGKGAVGSVANPTASEQGGWGLCGGVLLRHKSPTAPHAGHNDKAAFDLRRRCAQAHKNGWLSSPPKLREGSEAQAPGVPAGTERR
jgi:hypothetical protein